MKPSIPKGTRDFGPEEVRKRNYIFETLRSVFVKFGFQPIETPVMENLTTLTGKYGDEGDQLLFKVLNNGDYLSKADQTALDNKDSSKLTSSISKRGLRYDLTVPFARYVVMHQNDIALPFKRYQIQPVWRGDRPQKGRYQEFYQCDVDVVGSSSLLNEVELTQIFDEAFTALKMQVVIKVNNRKILAGIAEVAGIPDKMSEMTVAIDKLDKIGLEKVKTEMLGKGVSESSVDKIAELLEIKGLDELEKALAGSEEGLLGVSELRSFHEYLDIKGTKNKVEFDITLARGLSYYTGCIFEVKAIGVEMGSIGGGGRYDDLTAVFGLKNVSGVGVSFGAARIYDVMNELDLFPATTKESLKLILIAFDKKSHLFAFEQLNAIRAAGIAAELYPEPTKLKKQMKYANARNVMYTALIGDEEMENQVMTLKQMKTGEQRKVSTAQLIAQLK